MKRTITCFPLAAFVVLFLYINTCRAYYPVSIFHWIGGNFGVWENKDAWHDILRGRYGVPTFATDYAYIDSCSTVSIDGAWGVGDLTIDEDPYPNHVNWTCGATILMNGAADFTCITMSEWGPKAKVIANTTYLFSMPVFRVTANDYEQVVSGKIECGGLAALSIVVTGNRSKMIFDSDVKVTIWVASCYILLGGTAMNFTGNVTAYNGGYLTFRSMSHLPVLANIKMNTTAPFIFNMDPEARIPANYTTEWYGVWYINGVGNTTFNFRIPFNINAGASFVLGPGSSLDMEGPFNISGGSIVIGDNANVNFRDLIGTVYVTGGAITGAGNWNNIGRMEIRSGSFSVTAPFYNTGTIMANGGSSSFTKLSNTGVLQINAGATVALASSVAFPIAGTVTVIGGTLAASTPLLISTTPTFGPGSTVSCTGSGYLEFSGLTTINGATTFNCPLNITRQFTMVNSPNPVIFNSPVNHTNTLVSDGAVVYVNNVWLSNPNSAWAFISNSGTTNSTVSGTGTLIIKGSFQTQVPAFISVANLDFAPNWFRAVAPRPIWTWGGGAVRFNITYLNDTTHILAGANMTFTNGANMVNSAKFIFTAGRIKDSVITSTVPFQWDGGSLEGVTMTASNTTMTSSGTRTLKGSILTVSNVCTFTGGTLTLADTGSPTVTVSRFAAASTANLTLGNVVINSSATTTPVAFQSNGTLTVKGNVTVPIPFVAGSGTIVVGNGNTFSLTGGGVLSSSTLNVNTSATLSLGGTAPFTVGSVVSGAGTLNLPSGTVTFTAAPTIATVNINGATTTFNTANPVSSSTTLSAGVLSGTSTFNGSVAVTGGVVGAAGGSLAFGTGSTVGISGSNSVTFQGGVTNQGTMSITGTGGVNLDPATSAVLTNSGTLNLNGPGVTGNSLVNNGAFNVLQSATVSAGLTSSGTVTVSPSASLTLGATTNSASGPLTGSGTIQVPSGNTLTLNSGASVTVGTLTVAGTVTSNGVTLGSPSVSVSGTVSGTTWGTSAGTTLTVSSGTLSSTSGVTLAGTTSFSSASSKTLSGPFTSTGTVTVDGGSIALNNVFTANGAVTLKTSPTVSGGSITVGSSGSLSVPNSLTLSTTPVTVNGQASIADGATLSANVVVGSSGTISNSGSLILTGTSSSAGAISGTGTVSVPSGANFTVTGGSITAQSLDASGTMNVLTASPWQLACPVTVNGVLKGNAQFSSSVTINSGNIGAYSAADRFGFTSASTCTVAGASAKTFDSLTNNGTITVSGTGTIALTGTISNNNAFNIAGNTNFNGGIFDNLGTLSVSGTSNMQTTILQKGTLSVSGFLSVQAGSTFSQPATVSSGASIKFGHSGASISSITGAGTLIVNGGTVSVSGTASLPDYLSIINNGLLYYTTSNTISSNTSLTGSIIAQGANTVLTFNGPVLDWYSGGISSNLNVAAGAHLVGHGTGKTVTGNVVNDGDITFGGTILGSLTNNGNLNVGDPLSATNDTITVSSFTQSSTGQVNVDVMGATTYDRLVISNAAALDGNLVYNLEYTPTTAQLHLVSFGSSSTQFASINVQGGAAGTPVYTDTDLHIDYGSVAATTTTTTVATTATTAAATTDPSTTTTTAATTTTTTAAATTDPSTTTTAAATTTATVSTATSTTAATTAAATTGPSTTTTAAATTDPSTTTTATTTDPSTTATATTDPSTTATTAAATTDPSTTTTTAAATTDPTTTATATTADPTTTGPSTTATTDPATTTAAATTDPATTTTAATTDTATATTSQPTPQTTSQTSTTAQTKPLNVGAASTLYSRAQQAVMLVLSLVVVMLL